MSDDKCSAVTGANNGLFNLRAPLIAKTQANARVHGAAGYPIPEYLFVVFIQQVVGPCEYVDVAVDVVACGQVQQPMTFERDDF